MSSEPTAVKAGPQLVYFSLFDNCNVKCNMCDCWVKPRTHHSFAWYEEGLRRLLERQPRSIRFTGGEPLLLPCLGKLVGMAAEASVHVSVISNGRLLAAKAGMLAAHGCRQVVVSVDGHGAVHDRIRGVPGLFEKLSRGVAACQGLGLDIGVNTVLQRTNIDEVDAVAAWFGGVPFERRPRWWHLIPVRGEATLLPTADQLDRFGDRYDGLRDAAGCTVIGDPRPFDHHGAGPCSVPHFTRFVRADSRDVFGCNILSYATAPVGSLGVDTGPVAANGGPEELARRTTRGELDACSRCDPASRRMNYFLARASSQDGSRING